MGFRQKRKAINPKLAKVTVDGPKESLKRPYNPLKPFLFLIESP
jgi:hypothetical protein